METEKQSKKQFFGLSSVIFVLGMVSLLTDLSSQMIVPILPLYLTSVLHVQVGTLGIIEGIAESTASILKFFSGWISDRFGKRKWLMVGGYGLSNLIKPFFALSSTWGQVLFIRFADRFGKGIRTSPRDAILADTTTKEERGKAFGFRRSMDTLGAALGPFVTYLILTLWNGSYQAVFWISAIPGLIATLLLIFFLKEKRNPLKTPGNVKVLPEISFKGLNSRFVWFTLITTLFTIGNFSDAFLILRAKDVGMAAEYIPLTYFAYNIITSIFSTPFGIISDRIGRRPVLITGYIMFALIYLGFGLVHTVMGIWILFFIYGLYYATTEGIQKAYVADMVPEGQRGMAMGTFNALTGIAALPASVMAGFLWQSFGAFTAFGVSSILAIISALLMFILRI
ncbi:MFS transporter [Neobacillus drentensis]|uniref:MFS transporter n=1 Tax=Neobacillus drentensis TaxID=220684 RepID=UPI001F24DD4B|nr:MFS transporter [Neobacillus drentensis]ULT56407.1 MFS transporter [Neobacillus drentensis]